jgi:hypothetical protein
MPQTISDNARVMDHARRLLAEGREPRSAAIEAVDCFRGYTMEFAPSPAFHRDEWSEVEDALNSQL